MITLFNLEIALCRNQQIW